VSGTSSDGDLVRQVQSGRVSGYAELAERWAAPLLAFCRARVRQADLAEDLAQEALLRGLRHLHTLAEPDKFGAWLRGIALRALLDWRKSKGAGQVPFSGLSEGRLTEPVATDQGPLEGMEQAEERRQLLEAVAELPEEMQEVLRAYYYQDVTYKELGAQLGVSAATVNARLTQARALLRERLGALRR